MYIVTKDIQEVSTQVIQISIYEEMKEKECEVQRSDQ
jgi:hypothetical protein